MKQSGNSPMITYSYFSNVKINDEFEFDSIIGVNEFD